MKKNVLLLSLLSLFFCFNSYAQEQVIDNDLAIGTYNSVKTGYGKLLYFRGTAWNSNATWIGRYTTENVGTDMRVMIGGGTQSRFVVGYTESRESKWYDQFVVTGKGKVGIGISLPTYELDVNGTIRAKEILVQTGWADFVFKPEYELPSLKEVEAHIKQYKHLPGIPSEAEVLENGVGLGDMQVKLLQKIEELTLYVIEQQKEIDVLKSQINLSNK